MLAEHIAIRLGVFLEPRRDAGSVNREVWHASRAWLMLEYRLVASTGGSPP